MKKFADKHLFNLPVLIFCVLMSVCSMFAARVSAQTLGNENALTQSATGHAINSGVNVISNASPFNFGSIDQQVRTNQAAAVAPAFASPAVIGTCATAGTGLAAQVVGGGVSYAGPGGVDPGCDLQRDLNILEKVGAPQGVLQQRACQKPEIRAAIEANGGTCDPVVKVSATDPSLSNDPLIRARQQAR